MCDRVTIKKHAKEDMKYHYFRNVFVTFICFIILSGGYNLGRDKAYTINYSKLNNTPIVNKMGEIEEGYQKIEQELKARIIQCKIHITEAFECSDYECSVLSIAYIEPNCSLKLETVLLQSM